MAGAYVDDDGIDDLFHEDTQAYAVDDFAEKAPESPLQEDDADSNGDGDEEPPWLMLGEPFEDSDVVTETKARADYLESLPEDSDRPVADLEEVCGQLMQYLIGHPASLITKMRKFGGGKKGSKSRYFGEERSDDVMSDKVVTGCWACGKLTHESDECPFKRCFNCSAQGHQYFECPVSKTAKCSKCGNPGHEKDDCPVVEYEAGIIKRDKGGPTEGEDGTEYTDLFFCRCLRCGGDGHLNCALVPVGQILEPEMCVAAVPPGYESSVNNGSWAFAPKAPGQLLRPRGANSGKSAPLQALSINDDNSCWDFLKTGFCHRGEACSYSHGEATSSSKGGSKAKSQTLGFGKGVPKAPSQPPPSYRPPSAKAPAQTPPGYRTPSILPARPSAGFIAPSKRPRSENGDRGEDWSSLWEEEEDDEPPQKPWARPSGAYPASAPRPSVAIGARQNQYGSQQPRQNGNSWNNGQWNAGGNWNSNGNSARWAASGSGEQHNSKRWKQSW
mmetsp:Transcript_107740/g.170096  ORF Transcript_107740/g.170096 Transcript_107740/m.170096 type:complete len:501 (-) Transcript_107740:10-1512(-)